MTPETIAIAAAGIAVAGTILRADRKTRRDLGSRIDTLSARIETLIGRVDALERRMARLEGLLKGLARGKIELPPITNE